MCELVMFGNVRCLVVVVVDAVVYKITMVFYSTKCHKKLQDIPVCKHFQLQQSAVFI